MTSDPNPPSVDFDIVVESALRTDSVFPPPPQWKSQTLTIPPITVRTHIHPASLSATMTSTLASAPSSSDRPPPSILTIPDVGQGESSFCAFFQHCRRSETCPQLDISQMHYHVCLPGHHLDAPNIPPSTDVSMPTIVEAILKLIHQRNISRLVGIGIGYGATALLRAATSNPKIKSVFAGLVLISPVIAPSAYSERVTQTSDNVLSRQLGLGLTRRTKDRLMSRWLSDTMNEDSNSPVELLEEELDRRNANNVLRMLAEDTWRQDASTVIKDLKSRVLIITGKDSTLRYHVDDYISQFDAQNVSRLDIVDAGSLVHDEQPDRVSKALSLFLQGITGFS